MSKKELMLVIFLVIFGLLIDFFEEHKEEIRIDLRGIVDEQVDFDYARAISALSREDEFVPCQRVVIRNAAGKVLIKAAPVERIKLLTTLYVSEKFASEKEKIVAEVSIKNSLHENDLLIENFPPDRDNFLRRLRIVYELEVPEKTELYVENRFGTISVENLNSNVDLINKYGGLKLNRIKGEVHLKVSYGDIEAADLRGRTTIDQRYGKAKLENLQSLVGESKYSHYQIKDVAEQVEWNDAYSNFNLIGCSKFIFRGRYSELNAENIRGDVNIENSYRQINLKNVQGDLTISGKYSRMVVENLSGKILEITNSYQNIELRNVQVERALIDVKYCKVKFVLFSLEKELSANGKYSDWSFFFPPQFNPWVIVHNRFGNFENRSHLRFVFRSEGNENIYESKSEGAKIFLDNSYGNLSFNTYSSEEI